MLSLTQKVSSYVFCRKVEKSEAPLVELMHRCDRRPEAKSRSRKPRVNGRTEVIAWRLLSGTLKKHLYDIIV
jgi:hypothetical protein